MKPPSDSARAVLERYKAATALKAEDKTRLGSLVNERALRGDVPRFDVQAELPSMPQPAPHA